MNVPQQSMIHAVFQMTLSGKAASSFSLDVDLLFPAFGVTAVFGPSGCGKTTLLRCMAGLQEVQAGHLSIGHEKWQDRSFFKPVHERELGMVFQDTRLFSHLNVQQNLAYAVKRGARRAGGAKPDVSYDEIIDLLGIAHLLDRHTDALSGGEAQRVAIARALLAQPKLLLMDEPLAALDYQRKQDILPYLQKLSRICSVPIVYVTHSLDEVAQLADYVVLMDQGKVQSAGPLEEVLAQIHFPHVRAQELGVVIKAQVVEQDHHWHLMRVDFGGGVLWLRDAKLAIGAQIRVRVLAKDVSLALTHQDSSILNCLPAQVVDINADNDAAQALVRLKVGQTMIIAQVTQRSVAHLDLKHGMQVWAQIKSVALLA